MWQNSDYKTILCRWQHINTCTKYCTDIHFNNLFHYSCIQWIIKWRFYRNCFERLQYRLCIRGPFNSIPKRIIGLVIFWDIPGFNLFFYLINFLVDFFDFCVLLLINLLLLIILIFNFLFSFKLRNHYWDYFLIHLEILRNFRF